MKELQIKKTYLEDYDIYVKNYLTVDEIQFIAEQAIKCDKYADRKDVIDKYVIAACVDNPEQFNDIDLELIRGSGLMDDIRYCVNNLYGINDAISQEENIIKVLTVFLSELNDGIQNMMNKVPNKEELSNIVEKINSDKLNEIITQFKK